MKKTNKKGFTIVELVIVIAVIAILAAVLIPNISRLVKKANQSADIQLVRNMNTALQIDGAATKTYTTMHDALEAVKEAGYDVEKISKSDADNVILWDSVNQCFALLVDGKNEPVYYPETNKKTVAQYQLWRVVDNKEAAEKSEYSVYWTGAENEEITLTGVGFDAGEKTVKSVTYTGATEAHTVTIRTNSFDTTLTIDAENDTVYHYEQVGSVDIVKVASASYHESGAVKGNIVVAQGRVEVTEKADIKGTVLVTGNNVKVDLPENSTTEVAINDGATGAEVKGTVPKKAAVVKGFYLSKNLTTTADIDIVYLKEDAKLEKQLSLSSSTKKSSCILDLNGHTLTVDKQIKIDHFNLTIQGEGKIIYEGAGEMFVINTNSSATVETKLTINGGEYIATNGGIFANASDYADKNNKRPALIINDGIFTAKEEVVLAYNGNSVEINGGVFTSKDNAVLMSNGNTVNGGAVWTINGGAFNGYIESNGSIACGLYMANTDKVTINGGTFNITNGVAILARSGDATIGKDVVINLYNENGGIESGKVGDSTVKISAATAIVIDKKSGYPGGDPSVTNHSNYPTYDNSSVTK